jgi:hypothetical protein
MKDNDGGEEVIANYYPFSNELEVTYANYSWVDQQLGSMVNMHPVSKLVAHSYDDDEFDEELELTDRGCMERADGVTRLPKDYTICVSLYHYYEGQRDIRLSMFSHTSGDSVVISKDHALRIIQMLNNVIDKL